MNTPQQKVRLRPHHLLCTFCFEGKGYSPDFIRNYKKIAAVLEQNPETLIEIVAETDDVCAPCPHKRDQLCETQEKIAALDTEHSQMLRIKAGDTFSWHEALVKIKQHVTLSAFHQACSRCNWKALGICESKVRQL